MYQEEILQSIREQTKAIERQTEAIERQTHAFEQLVKKIEHIFGPGIEKEVVKIEDMTPEQREENRKRIFAELNEALASKRK